MSKHRQPEQSYTEQSRARESPENKRKSNKQKAGARELVVQEFEQGRVSETMQMRTRKSRW